MPRHFQVHIHIQNIHTQTKENGLQKLETIFCSLLKRKKYWSRAEYETIYITKEKSSGQNEIILFARIGQISELENKRLVRGFPTIYFFKIFKKGIECSFQGRTVGCRIGLWDS